MLSTIFLSLWLSNLLSASLTLVEKRQQPGLSDVIDKIPAINATSVKDIPPKINPKAKRQIIRYGPITLPPYTGEKTSGGHSHDMMGGQGVKGPLDILTGKTAMDPNGVTMARRVTSGFCTNCSVLGGKMDAVFANGTRADISGGVYLHHVIILDTGRKGGEITSPCPSGETRPSGTGQSGIGFNFLGGAVDEFTEWYTSPTDKTLESGYHLKNEKFLMQVEMINYKPEQQEVWIQAEVEFFPEIVGQDIDRAILSSTGCSKAGNAWKPGPNAKGEVKAEGYTVLKDGTIIAARGHVHDGGTSVNLLVNGKLACSSKATYGGKGGTFKVDGRVWETVANMSECFEPIKLKKGDSITITSTYDTALHPPRESHGEEQENMGIMTFIFVPDPVK